MKRSPRPSMGRSLFPALVTVVAAACDNNQPTSHRPQPTNPNVGNIANPPGIGPVVAPGTGPVAPPILQQPVRIDPAHIPSSIQGGLRTVSPMPAPNPTGVRTQQSLNAAPSTPSPEMLMAMAHSPELMGRPPGVYVVHEHPPGAPCQAVAPSAIQAALAH